MDQTIRKILETDAAIEARLQSAQANCTAMLETARQNANACDEARTHETSDAIFEYEEAQRADCETRMRALETDYDARSAMLIRRFSEQEDALLNALMNAVLAEAEA